MAAAALCGCTVLEDRQACPCRLYLDCSNAGNYVCDSMLVRVSGAGDFCYEKMLYRNDYSTPICVPVPGHGGAGVSVVDGCASYSLVRTDSGGLEIPEGLQCPQAYLYNSFVATSGEECVDSIKVMKNYCALSVDFVSEDMAGYSVGIYGNVSGFSATGAPSNGRFRFRQSIGNPSSCSFRLPRQTDDSLEMGIRTEGGKERRFALGKYIRESGYDWKRENLDDLCIVVDYSSTFVRIEVNGWVTEETLDVVI